MFVTIRQTVRVTALLIAMSLAAVASQAQQLYTNGTLVNLPGGGPVGRDVSRLQTTSQGMSTLGFNADFTAGRAVADDFTVPWPGWTINRIKLFAYQTDSTLLSTFTDLRLVIMDGPPTSPASRVIYGNPAVNALSSATFSNIYRDSETNPGTRRPVMTITANVNASLGAGTYWLVWAFGGTLDDGPWVPPITLSGQKATGNGLLLCLCNGQWEPATDTASSAQQGFPFILEGGAAGTSTLTVTPNVTSIRSGQRLVLTANMTAGSNSKVDAYILLDVPGIGTLSITTAGIVPGMVPIASNFVPQAFNGAVLDTILPPAPLGTYTVRGLLTHAGSSQPVTPANQTSFMVVP